MNLLGGRVVSMLPCLHSFCATCAAWLFANNNRSPCQVTPVCRANANCREIICDVIQLSSFVARLSWEIYYGSKFADSQGIMAEIYFWQTIQELLVVHCMRDQLVPASWKVAKCVAKSNQRFFRWHILMKISDIIWCYLYLYAMDPIVVLSIKEYTSPDYIHISLGF